MTLKILDKKIQLSTGSQGIEDLDSTIWYKLVMPYAMDSNKDIRFYDRRDLGIS